MNITGQLIEESAVTVCDALSSSPVHPNSLRKRETFKIREAARAKTSRQVDDIGRAVEHWRDLAIKHANRVAELSSRSPDSSIALSRLAHAQLAAGLENDAARTAEDVLKVVKAGADGNSSDLFDYSSAIAAVRILWHVVDCDRANYWLDLLPRHPLLDKLRAGIAAKRGNYDEALDMLKGVDTSDAFSLRGYIFLRKHEPQRALRELRSASRLMTDDADVYLNMAFAYWQLASPDRALRYARQAIKVARSRKDILFTLVEMLFSTGQYDAAYGELVSVRSSGAIETPDYLLMRAKIELSLGREGAAKISMKRALSLARSEGDSPFSELIQTNLSLLELSADGSEGSYEAALEQIRVSIRKVPDNIALVEMFAAHAHRVRYAAELRRYVERLASGHPGSRLNELWHRVFYLECDFDRALDFASRWSDDEPFDPRPASLVLILRAQLGCDDDFAQVEMSEALARRFAGSSTVLNNAAYALALCGRSDIARKLIAGSAEMQEKSFYLKATAGLVEIACGNLQEGMRLYRRAAEMADNSPDGSAYRSLMTQHQALALRQLGLLDRQESNAVIAQALPSMALPDGWEDLPHFRMLHAGVLRRGWEWPLTVE